MSHTFFRSEDATTPDKIEQIEVHDIHCQFCGNRYRFIVPPKLSSDTDWIDMLNRELDYYRRRCFQQDETIRKLSVGK